MRLPLAFLALSLTILAAPAQAQFLAGPPPITDENPGDADMVDNWFRTINPNGPPLLESGGACFDLSVPGGSSLYETGNGVFVYGGFHDGRPYAGVATSGGCPHH